MSDLQGLLFVARDRRTFSLVFSELRWGQPSGMLKHVKFHVCQAHLLEAVHD